MAKKRVLLIEEDRVLSKALTRILKLLQVDFLECDNSQTGIKLAKEYLPSLIICDVSEGFSTLKHLKSSPITFSIPVLYCSDTNSLAEWQQAIQYGASNFLLKPFARSTFTEAVIQGLSRERSVSKAE
jgi:response regulator RpfG family c-di-GMP phosphodiesterase